MVKKQQKIHLNIGISRIPMRIQSEEEEEIYRNDCKQINLFIAEYGKKYPNMTGEELLPSVL
jgi:hypothetical protein